MDPSIAKSFSSLGIKDHKTRYNVQCKYYKLGTCRLKDQCRFLHSDDVSPSSQSGSYQSSGEGVEVRKSVAPSSNTNAVSGVSIAGGSVSNVVSSSAPVSSSVPQVLPASSSLSTPSSSSSSSQVSHSFELKGVLSEEGKIALDKLNVPLISTYFDRRPFLHIVVLFAADSRVKRYSVEVQDTFTKYSIDVYLQSSSKTGQHIKAENLAEIITTSTADFLIVIGDRNMKNRSCQAKRSGKLVEMNVEQMVHFIWAELLETTVEEEVSQAEKNVASLTREQIESLLEKFAGLRHVYERVARLDEEVNELKDYVKHKGGEGGIYVSEETLASKLTRCQKSCIRFHKQLRTAFEQVSRLHITSKQSSKNTGPGLVCRSNYAPLHIHRGISQSLRDKLEQSVSAIMPLVEANGRRLSDYGGPLWAAYWETYKLEVDQDDDDDTIEEEVAPGWNCGTCTFRNEPTFTRCSMCDTARPESADDWSLTGIAGKKQRKRKREKQQKIEQEEAIRREAERKQEEERRLKEQREKEKQLQQRKQQEEEQRASSTASAAAQANRGPAWKAPVATPAPAPATPHLPLPHPETQAKAAPQEQSNYFPPSYAAASSKGTVTYAQVSATSTPAAPAPSYEYEVDFPSLGAVSAEPKPTEPAQPPQQQQYFQAFQQQKQETASQQTQPEFQQQQAGFQQAQLSAQQAAYYFGQQEAAQQAPATNGASNGTAASAFFSSAKYQPLLQPQSQQFASAFANSNPNPNPNPSANPNPNPYHRELNSEYIASLWGDQSAAQRGTSGFSEGSIFSNGWSSFGDSKFQAFAQPAVQQSFSSQYGYDNYMAQQEPAQYDSYDVNGSAYPEYYPDPSQYDVQPSYVLRPCCYCGQESNLECSSCSKIGYATYFCSPEHQSIMWKSHMTFHGESQQ